MEIKEPEMKECVVDLIQIYRKAVLECRGLVNAASVARGTLRGARGLLQAAVWGAGADEAVHRVNPTVKDAENRF